KSRGIFLGVFFWRVLFAIFHRLNCRGFDLFNFDNTHSQVHLAGTFIRTKQIGQAQNRVGRSGGNFLKHDEVPLWLQKGSPLSG
ncbi:hypothetical protein KCA24_28165, partial [Escherichia coli]|nr:hypothetical protein [Escherichia coli]